MASEQSTDEVIRNMRSIGIDLEPWVKRGLLRLYAARPGSFGLERHLVSIHGVIAEFDPSVVVIDPVTNFVCVGNYSEVKSMLTRMIDMFKSRQITAMFTSLTAGDANPELSEVGVSSLMDTWLLLRNVESNGERNRALYVLKSRGMGHSNQIREFVLSDHGVQLLDVYVGPHGQLTGSARAAQESRERAKATERKLQLQRKRMELEAKRQQLEAQIAGMRSAFEVEQHNLLFEAANLETRDRQAAEDRVDMGRRRSADTVFAHGNGRN